MRFEGRPPNEAGGAEVIRLVVRRALLAQRGLMKLHQGGAHLEGALLARALHGRRAHRSQDHRGAVMILTPQNLKTQHPHSPRVS